VVYEGYAAPGVSVVREESSAHGVPEVIWVPVAFSVREVFSAPEASWVPVAPEAFSVPVVYAVSVSADILESVVVDNAGSVVVDTPELASVDNAGLAVADML
jgi:hypothetical protein